MKIGRQARILELISDFDVETQDELADLLQKDGYRVTQATVSRDIRELKLTKISGDNGRQKYIALKNQADVMMDKYVQILKSGFVSMDKAQNIMVVRTVAGMAMAVAAALDALHIDGIVGCIAGDDTIMCAVRSVKETDIVMNKLSKLVKYK